MVGKCSIFPKPFLPSFQFFILIKRKGDIQIQRKVPYHERLPQHKTRLKIHKKTESEFTLLSILGVPLVSSTKSPLNPTKEKIYNKTHIPTATAAPKVNSPLCPKAPEAPDEALVPEPEDVVVDAAPLVEVEVDPAVPPDMEVGAVFEVALAARDLKFARERVEFAAVFSLTTITIPLWQCLAWEQYSHIGVVLFTMTV